MLAKSLECESKLIVTYNNVALYPALIDYWLRDANHFALWVILGNLGLG